MSLRFKLAVTGNLTKAMDDYEKRVAQAVTEALDEMLVDVQGQERDQIRDAGLGSKLPRTVQTKRFPRENSIGAAGIVFTKAPEIIRAFNTGAVIVPKHGRYMAIPTQFNLAGGRRKSAKVGGWNGVRVTPDEMIKSGASFVIPNKDGPGKLWMLTVAQAQVKSGKRGKIKSLAYAGGIVPIGGARRARVDAALKAGAVPMFTLLPQVRLTKTLDIARIRSKAQQRFPRLVRFKLDQIGEGV